MCGYFCESIGRMVCVRGLWKRGVRKSNLTKADVTMVDE